MEPMIHEDADASVAAMLPGAAARRASAQAIRQVPLMICCSMKRSSQWPLSRRCALGGILVVARSEYRGGSGVGSRVVLPAGPDQAGARRESAIGNRTLLEVTNL